MALLSTNHLAVKVDLSRNASIAPNISLKTRLNPSFHRLFQIRVSSASSASTVTPITSSETTDHDLNPVSKWAEFSKRVSGEWDGFGADFTADGKPIELPESVVPEAFREWGVQVFDWQTQCPTLAEESDDPHLTYKLIKLLPTVGCEADAATRHSVDRRIAGSETENSASAFAYDPNGSYVATWQVKGLGGKNFLELEHCLVDPTNQEIRLRVIQVVCLDGESVRLERIRVYSEQWYGPFRDGEQLGGCAIRETGFASTSALEASKVVGAWESKSVSVARFGSSDVLREFVAGTPQKLVRDEYGLVTLPKQIWSLFKESGDDETLCEVGWLFKPESALTSRFVLSKNGIVKEAAIAYENVGPEGT